MVVEVGILHLDFNNAGIYFALITKIDIFNGSFNNIFQLI